jgi:small subunit ribosomal protein S27e
MSKWMNLTPRPRSKFIRIKCPDCGNEQAIFYNASTIVKCNVCDGVLAEPQGGKAKLRGEIIESLD